MTKTDNHDARSASTSNKEFLKFRQLWLEQVCADAELAGSGFQLAFSITSFLNWETRETKVGELKLATRSHISDRWVRTLKQVMKDRGHIEII